MGMNKNEGKLPDFIVAGFEKCGTSALQHNLAQHPKISVATTDHEKCKISFGKEINFFSYDKSISTNYEGVDWYKSHFKSDGNLWGEISPSYADWVETGNLNRMHSVLGNHTKFIFTLRNPIHRAFSSFNHRLQLYKYEDIHWGDWCPDKSFEYNIRNHFSDFFKPYAFVLKTYEDIFSREQMCVIVQDKLSQGVEYNKIFKYLGVEDFVVNNKRHHTRKYEYEFSESDATLCHELMRERVYYLFDWLGYEIKEWSEFC